MITAFLHDLLIIRLRNMTEDKLNAGLGISVLLMLLRYVSEQCAQS